MTTTFHFTDALSLVREALTVHLLGDPQPAIPSRFVEGEGALIVVAGENASGKSMFRRIVSTMCQRSKPPIECMPISMEGRNSDFGGLRAMVYGDEQWQSTGVCSSNTVITGILTCKSRETPHVIVWDEPDLGLSENGAAGMGLDIADYAKAPNPHTIAMVVVTHSKPLVAQLEPLRPHFLYMGDSQGPKSIDEWLKQPLKPRRPEEIREAGHKRFKAIQKVLNRNKRPT